MNDNPEATADRPHRETDGAWVTGDEPMTGARASYLKTPSEQHHQSEAFDEGPIKAEASKRIGVSKGGKSKIAGKAKQLIGEVTGDADLFEDGRKQS